MQLVLTGGSSDARQTEPGSGHAVPWQCVSRKTEAPPLNGSDLGDLRERRGQPLCLRRQLSLPNIFLKRARHPGPRLAQGLPVRLPSNCSAPSGHHTSQGSQMLVPLNGPTLAEPAMVPQVDTAAVSSSVPYSIEGPLLPNKRNNLASPTRIVLPSHFAPWLESLQLSVSVANSISEVRALSTRCLKWSVFSDWCAVGNEDTSSCDITSILTFLQELLDKGHTLCLLEVYVTAIAANHTLKAGQSVGKNNLVVKFLRRVRRFNLPKTSLSIS